MVHKLLGDLEEVGLFLEEMEVPFREEVLAASLLVVVLVATTVVVLVVQIAQLLPVVAAAGLPILQTLLTSLDRRVVVVVPQGLLKVGQLIFIWILQRAVMVVALI